MASIRIARQEIQELSVFPFQSRRSDVAAALCRNPRGPGRRRDRETLLRSPRFCHRFWSFCQAFPGVIGSLFPVLRVNKAIAVSGFRSRSSVAVVRWRFGSLPSSSRRGGVTEEVLVRREVAINCAQVWSRIGGGGDRTRGRRN